MNMIHFLFFLCIAGLFSQTINIGDQPLIQDKMTLKKLTIITNEDEGFYKQVSVAVSSNKNIYVLDFGDKQIFVYDSLGNKLFQFGRKGDGPGELSGLVGKIFIANDIVVVTKFNNTSFYTLSGKHLFDNKLRNADFVVASKSGFTFVAGNKVNQIDIKGNILSSKRFSNSKNKRYTKDLIPINNGFLKYSYADYLLDVYDHNFEHIKSITRNFPKVKNDFDYTAFLDRYKRAFAKQVTSDPNSKKTISGIIKWYTKKINKLKKLSNGFEHDIQGVLGQIDKNIYIITASENDEYVSELVSNSSREYLVDIISEDDRYLAQINLNKEILSSQNELTEIKIVNNMLVTIMKNDELGFYIGIYDVVIN